MISTDTVFFLCSQARDQPELNLLRKSTKEAIEAYADSRGYTLPLDHESARRLGPVTITGYRYVNVSNGFLKEVIARMMFDLRDRLGGCYIDTDLELPRDVEQYLIEALRIYASSKMLLSLNTPMTYSSYDMLKILKEEAVPTSEPTDADKVRLLLDSMTSEELGKVWSFLSSFKAASHRIDAATERLEIK